jgi:hypothetical protein
MLSEFTWNDCTDPVKRADWKRVALNFRAKLEDELEAKDPDEEQMEIKTIHFLVGMCERIVHLINEVDFRESQTPRPPTEGTPHARQPRQQ